MESTRENAELRKGRRHNRKMDKSLLNHPFAHFSILLILLEPVHATIILKLILGE